MPYYRGKPAETMEELLALYATEDKTQIPIHNVLEAAKNLITEIHNKDYSEGIVIGVEGSWGTGKTSFVKILEKSLDADLNISTVYFDSLYYGNPSEATNILMDSIFEKLKVDFGILIKEGFEIAKNITPIFEVTNGLPKFTLSYKQDRKSTESILKYNIREKLKVMGGRLIVVVDDIDRLPPEDALHFLRIVRVLKEMPNIIVILPIDRGNLESLIRTQNVSKPKAYLQKIIDESFNLDPEQGNARILFERLLNQKYKDVETVSAALSELTWNLLLWEISLIVIKQYEREGSLRFKMAAGVADSEQWKLLEPISTPNGDNLVRKFIEQTSFEYGGSNYLVHVNDHASTPPNRRTIYRHYKVICGDASFTDFIYGTYIRNIQPQTEDVSFGPTMMDFAWWNETTMQQVPPNQAQSTEYAFTIPEDEQTRNELLAPINAGMRYMWDDVAGLASQFLPPQVLQYLAPRTLNLIVTNLKIDFNLGEGTERAEIQRQMRRTVQSKIDFIKD